MNFQVKKPYRSGSHRDPNNKLLTEPGNKYGVVIDMDGEDRPILERKTSAGTVVFENGMAVIPDDQRGKDIAAELKQKARYPEQIQYHPGHEAKMLKRDRQIMWRANWNTLCKIPDCTDEAVVQRLCEKHWSLRWAS